MKKYDKIMMQTALLWAEYSHCERAQVGSILARDGRIISNGYNGTISGAADNCCEEEVLRCVNCDTKFQEDNFNGNYCCPECNNLVKMGTQTKNNVVHAEANAILFAARNGIKTEGCTMYVTLGCCINCAKMIKQAGIVRVVYDSGYRKSEGIEFLNSNGIEINQIDEANSD